MMHIEDIKPGQLISFWGTELGLVVEKPKGVWVKIMWMDGTIAEASRYAIALKVDVK